MAVTVVQSYLRCPPLLLLSAGASSGNVAFDPPEYFGFVCAPADVPKAKVIVTIMDKNMVFADTILGSAVFPLKKMGNSSNGSSSNSSRDRSGSNNSNNSSASSNSAATTRSSSSSSSSANGGASQGDMHQVVLTLSDPDTGDTLETKVSLGLGLRSKSEGFGFGIERVFELQRWRPEQIHSPWGSSDKHLLPADPGKWSASPLASSSSKDKSNKSKDSSSSGAMAHFWTLDEASQLLPPGWSADPWRASATFGDGGWQYSTAFRYTK